MNGKITVILTLLSILLTACGVPAPVEGAAEQDLQGQTETQAAGEPEAEDVSTPERPAGSNAPEGLTMELERVIYDPSVERMTYFIRNDTEEKIWMGADEYGLQQWKDGWWRDLTWKEGMVSTLDAAILQPGGTVALTCWIGRFMDTSETGRYRLKKEIKVYTDMEGVRENEIYTLYAEFEIGESIYTAETPYGLLRCGGNFSSNPAWGPTASSAPSRTTVRGRCW